MYLPTGRGTGVEVNLITGRIRIVPRPADPPFTLPSSRGEVSEVLLAALDAAARIADPEIRPIIQAAVDFARKQRQSVNPNRD
jgi:hypothetical protein